MSLDEEFLDTFCFLAASTDGDTDGYPCYYFKSEVTPEMIAAWIKKHCEPEE